MRLHPVWQLSFEHPAVESCGLLPCVCGEALEQLQEVAKVFSLAHASTDAALVCCYGVEAWSAVTALKQPTGHSSAVWAIGGV